MTLQPLLKVIDKDDTIEIYDSDLPIAENLLYQGKRRAMTREEYDRVNRAHVAGVFAVGNIHWILADVTANEL